MQYVTFYVQDILYGIPILSVREISRFHHITQVQSSDGRIDGLINLRGKIVPVLNLGTCLDVSPVDHSGISRFVIIKSEEELSPEAVELGMKTCNDNMALLVNKIGDVVDADEKQTEPPPAHISHAYFSGVIKLENKLLTVLSTEWLGAIGKNPE